MKIFCCENPLRAGHRPDLLTVLWSKYEIVGGLPRVQLEAWKQSQHGVALQSGLSIPKCGRLARSVEELVCASVLSAFSLDPRWQYHISHLEVMHF